MPDKRTKFIHFYLTELLHHVKSMNEHRLPPVEYTIVKKLVHFVVSSGDLLAALERLKGVPSLSAFCGLMQKNLDKTLDAGFRTSVLMSSLETDSERISQILQNVLSTREQQIRLESELRPLGVDLELDQLAKSHPIRSAMVTPTPVSVRESIETSTEPSGTAFESVGDVAGFFNRRVKKSVTESPRSDKSTEVPLYERSAGTMAAMEQPGAFSDTDAFSVELRRLMVIVRSQIKAAGENLQDAKALAESADGFGELKRLLRVYSFGDLYGLVGRFERRFNEIVDNMDEKDLWFSTTSIDICLQLLDVFEATNFSEYDTTREGLTRQIQDLLRQFESSLVPRSRVSKVQEVTLSELDLGVPTEPPTDGRELRLDMSHVAEDDYRIFKDEVYAYFDSLDSALLDLRKDRSNMAALRILQLTLKGLQTASRVLKLSLFLDLCTIAWSGMNDIVRRRSTLSESGHRHLVSLRSVLRLLTEGQSVSESSYNELKQMLQSLPEAPAEPLPSVIPAKEEQAGQTVVELSKDAGWVEDMQGVINAYRDTRSALTAVAEEIAPERIQAQEKPADEVKPDDLRPADHLQEMHVQPARPVAKSKSEARAMDLSTRTASSVLLDLMATEGVAADLSSVKLESFIDRINEEPADIPETRGKKGVVVRRKKPRTEAAPIADRVSGPTELATTTEPETASGIYLQETHFSQVDSEILEIFIQESEGFFRAFDRALEKLRVNLKDESAIKEFERSGHSLKSSSRMLGFDRISGLAGVLELLSERYFEKEIEFTADVMGLFQDAVGALRTLFKQSKADIRSILERLIALERKLGAPNILTRNIPGAAEFEKILNAEATESPVPLSTGGTKNYFEAVGVDEEIVQIFREESTTYFRLISHALEMLMQDRTKTGAIRDIEKAAHSLRSSAKMLGFLKIADLMRPVESLAERIGKERLRVTDEMFESLRSFTGVLETLLRGQDTEVQTVITKLTATLDSLPQADGVATGAPPAMVAAEERDSIPRKTTQKRGARKKAVDIPDFQIQNEPIFKRLHVEEALLDEMAQTTATARGA